MRLPLFFLVFMSLISPAFSSEVVLDWGILSVNLYPSAPNHYIGYAEVTRSQSANLGKLAFQLYKDNVDVSDLSERHLYHRKAIGNTQHELELNNQLNKLSDQEFVTTTPQLSVHDALICVLKDQAGNIYTTVLSITPDLPVYNQPISVPPYSKMTHFPYQLVTRTDGNQVLKLDTTMADSKPTLEAYKKLSKVTVIHFPKFETVTNFISENDTVIALGKRNFTVHPVNQPKGDYFSLTTEPKDITESASLFLDWNKMIAKPDSPVFSLQYLKNIRNHTINFYDGNKKYEIVSMRMTYYDGRKLNKAYYWTNQDTYPVELIAELSDPFSVLIDRIILRDSKYGYIYIPQTYIFNFQ